MREAKIEAQSLRSCCSLVYLHNTDSTLLDFPDRKAFLKAVVAAINKYNLETLEENHPARVYAIGGLKAVAIITNYGWADRWTLRMKLGFKRSTKYSKGVRLMIAPKRKNELLEYV